MDCCLLLLKYRVSKATDPVAAAPNTAVLIASRLLRIQSIEKVASSLLLQYLSRHTCLLNTKLATLAS